jgi:hypothetical protein
MATAVLEHSDQKLIIAENRDDAIRKYQKIENLNLLLTDLIIPGSISGNQLSFENRILLCLFY